MIEEILLRENIETAWKKVRSNKGAPGIDGMTISDFPAFWQKEWPRISRAIMEGNDRLMEALREKIACRKTLGLLRRILTAGVVLPDGTLEATPIGVPPRRSAVAPVSQYCARPTRQGIGITRT